jgi:predicted SAM-dependent methyltransferase
MKMKSAKWLGFGAKGEHSNILLADIRRGVGDKVEDVRDLSFPNQSFKGVELHHVIEHMSEEDGDKALAEIFRVLEPGGELHISAPDLEACARTLLTENMAILVNIYSPHEDQAQWHRWGYTKKTMQQKLEKAGFKEIRQAAITEPHEFRFICTKYT